MKRLCMIFLTIILMLLPLCIVGAKTVLSEFQTEPCSKEDKENILKYTNITALKTKPEEKPIACFDVNKDGLIVLGLELSGQKEICVYNSDGEFQYGFRFNTSGDFSVMWKENNISLYLIRDAAEIIITPEGKVENIYTVLINSENNSYYNNVVEAKIRKINNTTYMLKNDLGFLNSFASTYSQLIVKNNNTEKIIYDVNSVHLERTKSIFIGVGTFFFIVVFSVIVNCIKLRKKSNSKQ